MKRLMILMLAASAFACPAGRAYEPSEERENTEQVRHRAESERFYLVTRLDYRKCIHPLCGGMYVAEVNQAESTCFGDHPEPDCYVAELDLTALDLEPGLYDEVLSEARNGHVLLRGAIHPYGSHAIGKLVVKEAWRGATGNPPTGGVFQVKDNGIVCITYPCASVSQLTLNTGAMTNLGGLDLTTAGASDDVLTVASNALFGSGLMVAGTETVVEGPGGQAQGLAAAEIYLAVGAPLGEACGNTVCAPGTECCNASCGLCVAPGGACIQLACEDPCAHSECTQGGALTPECSSCAGAVCDADPFCCDESWDGLCVAQAKELCDVCEAPPPPVCAHDECEAGSALESACSSCAAAVCATDSFCCNNSWDALCVQEAGELCEQCAAPAPTCAHDTCAKGVALDADCSTCAAAVCDYDPYCCETAWDGLCVSEAGDFCGC